MAFLPNCVTCGRFMRVEPGVAWRMVYSGALPEPDREIYRCATCVAKLGPFYPQPGIKPECSCGIVADRAGGE